MITLEKIEFWLWVKDVIQGYEDMLQDGSIVSYKVVPNFRKGIVDARLVPAKPMEYISLSFKVLPEGISFEKLLT